MYILMKPKAWVLAFFFFFNEGKEQIVLKVQEKDYTIAEVHKLQKKPRLFSWRSLLSG